METGKLINDNQRHDEDHGDGLTSCFHGVDNKTNDISTQFFIPHDNGIERVLDDIQNSSNSVENVAVVNQHLKLTKNSNDINSSITAQTSLAFTIDFGENNEKESKSRYKNLFQRFNARHKRNLSTSKLEIKNKNDVADLSPNLVQKRNNPLSINSEGYFSSEDDAKRKAEKLSNKFKELGLKTRNKGATKKTDIMSRSLTEDSQGKRRSYHEESLSNFIHELNYSSTMNDLSKMQSNVEEERNRVQNSPEKKYTKNIEYIEISHDYEKDEREKQSSHYHHHHYQEKKEEEELTEKLSNINYLSSNFPANKLTINDNQSINVQSLSINNTERTVLNETNLDVFNVSNVDTKSGDEDDDDAVSEAGTYTIHKDYTDEEKARMDIDKAFSVGVLTEEESTNEVYVHHFKMQSSRDTNTWITEWASQVAEHNSLPPTISSTTGRTPPLSPTKIPSPLYSKSQRLIRNRYEQSDSSLDADIQHLRDRIGSVPNQMIDSGGESDEDTSNSYNTPQRTPTHTNLVRRGSLSECLFKRSNDCRRSMRNNIKKKEELIDLQKSPSHILARLHLQRSNSIDRKSDTGESNSSRRSSLKNYTDDNNYLKHTNSPILDRLKSSTSKLTNSPILGHKKLSGKNNILNSPKFDNRPKTLIKTNSNNKNIGYFTCVENSPYMLRKSYSTSNYQDVLSSSSSPSGIKEPTVIHNNSLYQRNIQRSSSNNSIVNSKNRNLLIRYNNFNDNNEKFKKNNSKNKIITSDSSSGETDILNSPVPPISTGIKLNRAFSIRRARVTGDSDTTPNTTPEERRKKAAQNNEIKSAPNSARQTVYHHRPRTNSVGTTSNKDTFNKKQCDLNNRPRVSSSSSQLSRNEGGRYSMRNIKPNSAPANSSRPNLKTNNINNNNINNINNNNNQKNSGRSNSSLTSKEVEFQNWKRRKNYNPQKAAAEAKKKLDISKKTHSTDDASNNSVLRSASFHGTRGALSLTDDWSDNELNNDEDDDDEEDDDDDDDNNEIIQIPPPCSPLGSDSDLDTSSYLQTTQNVMSAMSARITVYQSPPVDSGGESDEDTSRSLRQSNKITRHEISDTESSDEPQGPIIKSSIGAHINRDYGLRKERNILPNKNPLTKAKPLSNNSKIIKTDNGNAGGGGSIARTDSGRFSMRNSKNSSSNMLKNKSKDVKKSNMQLTKEQEMQNWKRRKSYNPMQAALEGKRKANLAKKNLNSESSSVLRSQSFHGPVTLGISEWSDEDISASADEVPIY